MVEGTTLSALSRWENFYVIVGSSAGALTGLQFVVMALIAGSSNVIQPTLLNFCKNLCIDKSVSPNLCYGGQSHVAVRRRSLERS